MCTLYSVHIIFCFKWGKKVIRSVFLSHIYSTLLNLIMFIFKYVISTYPLSLLPSEYNASGLIKNNLVIIITI